MSTQVPGKQLLLANYGPTAARAAAVLPATATTPYFNIVGGNVIITSIFGQVTTVMSATATNLSLNYLHTASGGNVDLATATAVESTAVGIILAVPTIGSGLTKLVYGVQNNEFVLGPGTIRAVTSATNTGATKWYVNYISLDPGAYVVAA